MTNYIETFTKDGLPLRIEVEDTSKATTGFTRQSPPSDVSTDAVKDAYDQLLQTIRGCADGVIDALQNLDTPPSSASVDFAIKIDFDVGAMVAKSGGDSQFKVSLSWKQAESNEDD